MSEARGELLEFGKGQNSKLISVLGRWTEIWQPWKVLLIKCSIYRWLQAMKGSQASPWLSRSEVILRALYCGLRKVGGSWFISSRTIFPHCPTVACLWKATCSKRENILIPNWDVYPDSLPGPHPERMPGIHVILWMCLRGRWEETQSTHIHTQGCQQAWPLEHLVYNSDRKQILGDDGPRWRWGSPTFLVVASI